jgi:hypothetical protein
MKVTIVGDCNPVGLREDYQSALLFDRKCNDHTSDVLLAFCNVGYIAYRVSDDVFLGDTRKSKDFEVVEVVDHWSVVIEDLISGDRFSLF